MTAAVVAVLSVNTQSAGTVLLGLLYMHAPDTQAAPTAAHIQSVKYRALLFSCDMHLSCDMNYRIEMSYTSK
jgi:hypothetical protein